MMIGTNASTCTDSESGIYQLSLFIGTKQGVSYSTSTKDIVLAVVADASAVGELVQFGPEFHTFFGSLSQHTGCSNCSQPAWVSLRCVNRAGHIASGSHQIGVRADGSPPTCDPDRAILGSGAYPHVPMRRTWLEVNGYHEAVRDDETVLLATC